MRLISARPLLVAACLLSALPAFAAEEQTGVTTTGTATVYVTPDKATISIYVNTVDKELPAARAANTAKAQKIIEAIKAQGIAQSDIGTSGISVGEHYDEEKRKPDGQFTASQSYAVTVKNLSNLEKLIDAIAKVQGSIPGVSMDVTEMRKYRDQARDIAIHAAEEKAKALATALHCELGKPRAILEVMPSRYGMSMSNTQSFAEAAVPVPDTPETLPLGKIEVQATVQVTFELK
jgi:uncharacterized protein YggE